MLVATFVTMLMLSLHLTSCCFQFWGHMYSSYAFILGNTKESCWRCKIVSQSFTIGHVVITFVAWGEGGAIELCLKHGGNNKKCNL
jgi:hypothetical protein